MRKYLLILLVALTAASCATLPPDRQHGEIAHNTGLAEVRVAGQVVAGRGPA